MITIQKLNMQHYDNGNRSNDYFYLSNFTIPVGIGNEIVIEAVAKYAIKVQINNCTLHESLSSPEAIENEIGEFVEVSDGTTNTFILDKGVSYLKATNTSATEVAQFNITCL